MSMRFRLRQMEVFRAVMLAGSINGAAKLLFTSQPAVSRIISHTEKTLGLALFNRVKGKLVATPEGEALFREVDDFYRHALRVDSFARGLAHGSSGQLTIAVSPCLSRAVMPRVLAVFMQRYPKIHIDFHTILLNDIAQDVLSKKADLAITVLPLEHPNLIVEPFTQGRMVCVLPRAHDLANAASVSLTDLGKYPLISHHLSIPFGQLVASALRKAGINLSSRIDIHQTETACSLVRAGLGVAVVDQYSVEGIGANDLCVLPLEEEILLSPSIVRSAFDNHESHADKLIEILHEQYGVKRD